MSYVFCIRTDIFFSHNSCFQNSHFPPGIFSPGRGVLVCLAVLDTELFHCFDRGPNIMYLPFLVFQEESQAQLRKTFGAFLVPNLQCCENEMYFFAWVGHTKTEITVIASTS